MKNCTVDVPLIGQMLLHSAGDTQVSMRSFAKKTLVDMADTREWVPSSKRQTQDGVAKVVPVDYKLTSGEEADTVSNEKSGDRWRVLHQDVFWRFDGDQKDYKQLEQLVQNFHNRV